MGLADILPVSFEFSPRLGVRRLPELTAGGESTSVPGLFVAGDLADAPVIKVALRRGYEVALGLAASLDGTGGREDLLDVVVVGAGPAGIGAALALRESGLRFAVIERGRPFETIQNFPRAKRIFAEPRELDPPPGLPFRDTSKEELLDRWERALDRAELPIRQPEEVTDIRRSGGIFELRSRLPGGEERRTRCRRVLLAIGRRGGARRLEVPGANLPKVAYALRDPAEHAGRAVLVVGGGDSAVEAAVACAEAGAEVTLSYRGESVHRARRENREKLEALAAVGRLRAEYGTVLERIRPEEVVLRRGDERLALPNDAVIAAIGAEPPVGFLRRIGVRMAGDMSPRRAVSILLFAAGVWCFYVLKAGVECAGGTGAACAGGRFVAKKPFWPFGPGDLLGWLPGAGRVDLGFRVADFSFWGTVAYSLAITVFGIRAMRRHRGPGQRRRYVSLILFQLVFLFGIPELLAPLVIDRPWKLYALSVPWPLSTWSLVDSPAWAGDASTAVLWLAVGAVVAFVAIPLYVRRHGERFCSWLCGCGGLAETFGDRWRQLAPRGRGAKRAEGAGRVVLLLAVPVTLLALGDAWGLLSGGLFDAAKFAEHWYGLVVDFWLAAVVGVAMYPYLGNRIWCRFFCPLRAWMELLARRFSRVAILSDDRCIGCGECTRWCQMGIDVQSFAQRGARLDNRVSACIQCGICVEVCPMDVLELDSRG